MDVNIFLFNDFETLDIFGPTEILGCIEDYNLHYFSEYGGMIINAQGVRVMTEPISISNKGGILVISGGIGTRLLVTDISFLHTLREIADKSCFCLSICTGSALLAKCGVLDYKRATSNKRVLEWVKSMSDKVKWIDKARWVVDEKFYTSSGVSAGMDMTLGFICDRFGKGKATEIANLIEYVWNDQCTNDIFVKSSS